jgi:UTP-glucose-1-phosphate uridylyltransferase
MNSNLSLVILAGGLGSRYKGSKQIDVIGEQQAFLLEFAIYDAVEAGFGKIVLLVNENVHSEMKSSLSHWESKIDLHFVLQALTPEQQSRVNVNRSKPWGTAQALLCTQPFVDGPFVVMNADDYYGKNVMETGRSFFQQEQQAHGLFSYALTDTLSEHGGVSRGMCAVDEQGFLKDIVECHGITKDARGLHCQDGSILSENDRVSMNLWFFQASIFDHLSSYFESFFALHHQELTAECYLPSMVQSGIQQNACVVKVLSSHEQWVGLTFPEDKESVIQFINSLTNKMCYPKSFSHE